MKIHGIGVDIVETSRLARAIEKHGEAFLARVFTDAERTYCGALRTSVLCYAARFAAKEAVAKAFGTGIGERINWLEIEVQRSAAGQPSINLSGAGQQLATELGVTQILISLSHSDHYAVAQAIACLG